MSIINKSKCDINKRLKENFLMSYLNGNAQKGKAPFLLRKCLH